MIPIIDRELILFFSFRGKNTKPHDLLKEEKMLCWGYWSVGVPGADSTLQTVLPEPQSSRFIHRKSVKEVACGENHSVFLLEDGEVYTCGANTSGQLGHEREGNKPGILFLNLWNQPLIVIVAMSLCRLYYCCDYITSFFLMLF